jgi:hypothetical protein
MPQPQAKASSGISLLQRLLQAAAPGGALTRKSFLFGLAAALVATMVVFFLVLQLRAHGRDPASMRLADADLARLPTRSFMMEGEATGPGEVRQYGLFDDANKDATLIMVTPAPGQPVARNFVEEVRALDPVDKATRAVMSRSYELHTRFGLYQAAEIQVDIIGRWKDCIAFLSRFETAAIYVKGWYCDAVGSKPNAERLACVLDSLVLDRPLGSANANSFMRERMARPSFCAASERDDIRDLRAHSGSSSRPN